MAQPAGIEFHAVSRDDLGHFASAGWMNMDSGQVMMDVLYVEYGRMTNPAGAQN